MHPMTSGDPLVIGPRSALHQGRHIEDDVEMKEHQEQVPDIPLGTSGTEATKPEERAWAEEQDASVENRHRINPDCVSVDLRRATPNVMGSADGKLLLMLTDGGMQYMLAGAQATIGVRTGRYMFEVRIVEMLNPYDGNAVRGTRIPMPRRLLRVGFALAGCNLLTDDAAKAVYFDSEGFVVHQQLRQKLAQRFGRDQILSVVLNLDQASANENTVSLFIDGKRACDPQPLPDNLVGKVLVPTLTYKNVSVHINFGPIPKQSLTFQCHMLAEAAAEDVDVSRTAPQIDKPTVLFPIGLPDQGLFDWLDQYLEEHPSFFELSDRNVLDWACKSGIHRPNGYQFKVCNDKPGMNFGITSLDDLSIQGVLQAVIPALKRDTIVMELVSNLLAAERKKALLRFPASRFKRVAVIAIADLCPEYKARVHKLAALGTSEEEARAAAAAAAATTSTASGAEVEKTPDEHNVHKDEPPLALSIPTGIPHENGEVTQTKHGLQDVCEVGMADTENVQKNSNDPHGSMGHQKMEIPDATPQLLAKSYANFSLPATDEGFDEIRYVWQSADKSDFHLKDWILNLKRTQRIEDLEPSSWFKERWEQWNHVVQCWKQKQAVAKETEHHARDELDQKIKKMEHKTESDQQQQRQQQQHQQQQVQRQEKERRQDKGQAHEQEMVEQQQQKELKQEQAKRGHEREGVDACAEKIPPRDGDPEQEQAREREREKHRLQKGREDNHEVEERENNDQHIDAEGNAGILEVGTLDGGEGRQETEVGGSPAVEAKEKENKAEDHTTKEKQPKETASAPGGREHQKNLNTADNQTICVVTTSASEMMDIDEEDLDVFGIPNIEDAGNGRPLFVNFVYEDWVLLSLRYEIHLMTHAFRRELNDPDRPSFIDAHFTFYYHKYFNKDICWQWFGVSGLSELVQLIDDTVRIDRATLFMEPQLSDDVPFDMFVRLTEDRRRERQRCIDAGDETAMLRFMPPAPPVKQPLGANNGSNVCNDGGNMHRTSAHSAPQQPPAVTGRAGSGFGRPPMPRTGAYGYGGCSVRYGHYGGPAPTAPRGYSSSVHSAPKRPQSFHSASSYPPAKHPRHGGGHPREPFSRQPPAPHVSANYGGKGYR